ncbi:hypothetical protein QE361_002697 [Sphingomonas sp. SORGH_AS802]|nr:hypothetical protein [Sphingomonas sp. SORGH_AS_0438]MDR6135702.1 hypothetical protein [Sphingomonas sp. SORGH_AS_0802]
MDGISISEARADFKSVVERVVADCGWSSLSDGMSVA